MLHSFVTAVSEISGEEPDKTAFYVLGGLLALWAVAVSALGIARHDDFPSSDGAARGIMGITVVLVAAAMASAVITA
jgi:hypothetical protein